MRVEQERVREFHEKYGFLAKTSPEVPTEAVAAFRYRLMREELEETREAMERGDIVAIADGLTDLLYTVLGSAVACGLDLQPIFDEVHASNMTKDPDPGDGKPVKGAAFQPPRLAPLVLAQMPSFAEAESAL